MTDYTFLPWIRRGVSRSLTGAIAPSSAARAALSVAVGVNGAPVGVPMTLHGPGDAIGIDRAAIARVDPVPGATDAEPFLFAAIELIPADLPWLLTPGGPDGSGRLLPWLALVVVPQNAGKVRAATDGGLDRLEVTADELPPPEESWAWAHAQLLGALSGPAADSLDAEPGRWRARILSPRRLDPGNSYLAVLVPLFAAGAAAALGAPAPAQPLAFAWNPAADGTVTLPAYHHWTFATSPDADFETLARRLVARELPKGVGELVVDFSQPGAGVHPATGDLWVEGALGRIGDVLPALPATAAAQSADIATLVARTVSPLVVGPPLYGEVGAAGSSSSGGNSSGSAGTGTGSAGTGAGSPGTATPAIPVAGWEHEVNVDPRVRAITGVGAAVIRRDQDALVASAWRQSGAMRAANRSLGWLTMARTVASGLYRRHFAGASVDALAQWSAPAQSQVRMAGPTPMTMAALVASTAMSPAALGTPARRMLRPTGPLISRALAGLEAAAAAGTPSGGAPTVPAGPAGPAVPTGPVVTTGPVVPTGPTAPTGPTGPAHPAHPGPIGPIHGGHVPVEPFVHIATDPVEPPAPAPSHTPAESLLPIGDGPGRQHLPNGGGDGTVDRPPTGGAGGTGGTGGAGGSHTGPGGIHGGHGPVITGGGVIVISQSPPSDAPPGLVTMERVRKLMGGPADLAGFGLDGLTSALVKQRALLRIASALVDENGGPSGLPPNSHASFAAAAEPTQDAVLAQLTTARKPPVSVSVATIDHAAVLAALDPTNRFQAIAGRRVSTSDPSGGDRDPMAPVTLAPTFPQPAVDSLVSIAPDLLLPGLDSVLANTVTLATTDQRFVEAFLLGMNHELDRELRWRGYPTVPGSTYFSRFWNTAPGQADIVDIAGWTTDSELGSHEPPRMGSASSAGADDTVLVVRGDLVRRYPGIAVTAIPLVAGAPSTDPAAELSPVLRGTLDPDVLYAGFAFPPSKAADFAYVLTQQPGAPRFGLDEESDKDASSVAVRNDLAWSQLGTGSTVTAGGPLAGRTLTDGAGASAVWGRNSADMAWLTRQAPIRLVLPGPELLSGMGTGPS